MKKLFIITFFGLLVFLPHQVDAAITHVVGTGLGDDAGATSYTEAFNNTGVTGDMLIVSTGMGTGHLDNVSVTYDGDAVALALTSTNPDNFGAKIYIRDGSLATGTNNMVIGTFGGNRNLAWGVTVLSGASGTGAENTGGDSGGSYTSNTATLTTTVDNSFHLTTFMSAKEDEWSTSDSTKSWSQENTTGGIDAGIYYDLIVSAGADTNSVTWSSATDERAFASIEIKVIAEAVEIKKQSEIFF